MDKHSLKALQSTLPQKPEASLDEENIVSRAALICGMLILENGGETCRAEETVMRICRACGYNDSEVIAFPTGLIVSLIRDGETIATSVRRVNKRTIDLTKLNEANSISRAIADGRLDIYTAAERLDALMHGRSVNKYLYSLIAALSTALFSILYGGSLFDAAVAFLCGGTVQYISSVVKYTDLYKFEISLLGGGIIALYAVTLTTLFGRGSIDKIMIGAIIPLLPGLALNSAIRDILTGDLISGSSRLTEVILVAFSLAAGAGIVFAVYLTAGGIMRHAI